MAAFYTCILLLLSLLLRSDAAALNDVCMQNKQPPRCLTLIESSDSRSKTASLPVLGEITIVAALDSVGHFKIKVQELYLSASDPKLKSVYLNCVNLYLSALDELLSAPEYLQNGAYDKLRAAARVARRGVAGCAAAAGNNVDLNRENRDTGILADAIFVIANKLSA